MLERRGDLWSIVCDARCITTNGFRKKDGRAVMGRGCAKEAADRYPGLQSYLGLMLADHGNHVHSLIAESTWTLVSFPVKHAWFDRADLDLIERSAHELVALTDERGWKVVALPRPGCGNGQLHWTQVQPLLDPILDHRFLAVTR